MHFLVKSITKGTKRFPLLLIVNCNNLLSVLIYYSVGAQALRARTLSTLLKNAANSLFAALSPF